MNKVAFMSMDVESFYDTTCLANKNIIKEEKYNAKEGIVKYLDLLNKYHIQGTFFITCDFIPYCKDIIKEIIKGGHEIALHCYHHISPKDMTILEFKESIQKGIKTLEDEFNITPVGYRAPLFGLEEEYLKIIKELGFKYDSSAINYNTNNNAGHISLNKLNKVNDLVFEKDQFYEFSLAKKRILGHNFPISGGGYVRMFIWQIVKHKINQYLKENNAYLFYAHPFELLDQNIKIEGLKLHEKIYFKRGCKTFLKHIEEIILLLKDNNYSFYTMKDYINNYK